MNLVFNYPPQVAKEVLPIITASMFLQAATIVAFFVTAVWPSEATPSQLVAKLVALIILAFSSSYFSWERKNLRKAHKALTSTIILGPNTIEMRSPDGVVTTMPLEHSIVDRPSFWRRRLPFWCNAVLVRNGYEEIPVNLELISDNCYLRAKLAELAHSSGGRNKSER